MDLNVFCPFPSNASASNIALCDNGNRDITVIEVTFPAGKVPQSPPQLQTNFGTRNGGPWIRIHYITIDGAGVEKTKYTQGTYGADPAISATLHEKWRVNWLLTEVDPTENRSYLPNGYAKRAMFGEFKDKNGTELDQSLVRKMHGWLLFDTYPLPDGSGSCGMRLDLRNNSFVRDADVSRIDIQEADRSAAVCNHRNNRLMSFGKSGNFMIITMRQDQDLVFSSYKVLPQLPDGVLLYKKEVSTKNIATITPVPKLERHYYILDSQGSIEGFTIDQYRTVGRLVPYYDYREGGVTKKIILAAYNQGLGDSFCYTLTKDDCGEYKGKPGSTDILQCWAVDNKGHAKWIGPSDGTHTCPKVTSNRNNGATTGVLFGEEADAGCGMNTLDGMICWKAKMKNEYHSTTNDAAKNKAGAAAKNLKMNAEYLKCTTAQSHIPKNWDISINLNLCDNPYHKMSTDIPVKIHRATSTECITCTDYDFFERHVGKPLNRNPTCASSMAAGGYCVDLKYLQPFYENGTEVLYCSDNADIAFCESMGDSLGSSVAVTDTENCCVNPCIGVTSNLTGLSQCVAKTLARDRVLRAEDILDLDLLSGEARERVLQAGIQLGSSVVSAQFQGAAGSVAAGDSVTVGL